MTCVGAKFRRFGLCEIEQVKNANFARLNLKTPEFSPKKACEI